MATLLYRLGKTAYRRWPLFIAAWFVALIAVGAVAGTMSKPMTDNFSIPGIPSEKAADLQAELFPGATDPFDQANATVVVAVPDDAPEGATLADPEYAAAVDELVAELQDAPQIDGNADAIVSPVAAADGLREQLAESGLDQAAIDEQVSRANLISDDGRVGTIGFVFDVDTVTDVEPASQDAVLDILDDARGDLTVEVNGAGMQSFEPPGATSEAIGIGVALIILIITFGSFVAAGLPILTAVLGVALSLTGITALTAFMDIGSSTPILSTMIGLAVGIDYTLFILARYRGELRHTDDRQEAVGVAVGTAGSAVVFAGLTVLIALSALAVVGIPFLTAMGVAAGATVLISVLVALTLLPAVLGVLKSKAFGGQVRKYSPKHETDARGREHVLNNGVRWARIVGKRPLAVVLLVTVALGALAIPLKDLHLAFPTDSTAAADTTQRKASDLLTEAFGPGQEATFLFVVDGRELAEGDRQAAYDEVLAWVEGQDGIEYAVLAAAGAEGGEEGGDPAAAPVADGATIIGVPTTGPQDSATEDLLADVRDGQSEIEQATGTTLGITGLTPITVDVSEQLAGALPIYLAVVVGLAFILLMIVFRSIIVPLTATLGFLLSVLATLGLTVLIFQEGAFGIMDPQPIVSFMPIFLIGVVFGLAMDYQVFLVTRIREAHVHGADPREAVIDGFRNSARVVAAAAAIMISVFAAFIAQDDAIIKSMGFALAVAVFLDAFIVRMTFIPALMYLLGDNAWYLPKWLDRVLPDVDVEGEKLDRAHLRKSDDDQPVAAGI